MVTGLEKFRDYFKDYVDSYVIIGGTALQKVTTQAGFNTRTTRDIDIILVVEAIKPAFIHQFWDFIRDGEYERQGEGAKEGRKYYRFDNPAATDFPEQLELFSRRPDFDLADGATLTPIPIDDDISSLSAILMDEDYYQFTLSHSTVEDNLHFASTEALICLKARAYLDLKKRKDDGDDAVKSAHIKKHRRDVFLLGAMLAPEQRFSIPAGILADLQRFIDVIATDLPEPAIFKVMELAKVKSETVLETILTVFELTDPRKIKVNEMS